MKIRLLSAIPLLIFCAAASAQEKADGGKIFDGKTLTGWVKVSGKPAQVGQGWEIADGILHLTKGGGDLLTEQEFGNFEFTWEWKISPGGNSGVKYRVTTYGKEMLGPEYQILDDDKHSDGKLGTHRTACIYDLFPRAEDSPIKPVGEWNQSRILVQGTKFEHWINGRKVAECDTATEEWRTALAKSKFRNRKDWAQNPKGKILLQDHGNEVWFRNLVIKELPAK